MNISVESSARIRVPEDAFAADQPLCVVERGPYVASLHRGQLAVVDPEGHVVLAIGDPDQAVFLRSAAKPFQAIPAVLAGALDRFNLSPRETAVLCASHSAEPRHTEAVLSALGKAGLDESALRCGIHPPTHILTAEARLKVGLAPSPACNNCSGAHTGMLLAARAAGWDITTYHHPEHPLQRQTVEILARFAGMDPADITWGIDNCNVPAFRLPLRHAALAYARFATGQGIPSELSQAAGRLRQAMISEPAMIGGEDRFDSDLMAAAQGTVVVKGGADGFQGVGLLDAGLGYAVKISDGAARPLPPVTLRVLQHFGALSPVALQRLEPYFEPLQYDLAGDLVGRIVPTFQLDHAS